MLQQHKGVPVRSRVLLRSLNFALAAWCGTADIFRKADHSKPASVATDWSQHLTGQTAANGALSMLYAATSPDLEGEAALLMPPWPGSWPAARRALADTLCACNGRSVCV